MHDAPARRPGSAVGSAREVVDARLNTGAVHVEALEVMSDLLLGVGEGSPPDAFFSSLCEAICRLTSMRRAVLFRYDSARRRVRAVGAHGIELDRMAELFVTVDSVPVARRALVEDRVLEVLGADDFDVPLSVRELLEGVRIVCTPMAAAGRYVGVVLSEREAAVPEMGEDERHLLWTLGKAIAMASVAREVTAYDEQSRQLQQRIDLAREIHEGVVQRLFGISLALSREELLDAEAQRRCAREVQTALGDLRTALQRPLGHSSRPTAVTFAEELERVRALHPGLDVVLEHGTPEEVPGNLEALAQSILIEAVRNARKHADATRVGVSLRHGGGTFVLEVRNDGAHLYDGGRGGVGLRLATLEALQYGGVLEYGESEPGAWQVRLVVPTGQ
jgi:signal transduction histidine kinase